MASSVSGQDKNRGGLGAETPTRSVQPTSQSPPPGTYSASDRFGLVEGLLTTVLLVSSCVGGGLERHNS